MKSRLIVRAGVLGAAVCTLAAVAIPAAPALALKSPAPSALSTQVRSYVVFLTSPTARVSTGTERGAVLGAQAGFMAGLTARGVRVQSRWMVPDTLTVGLTLSQVASLRAGRAVAHVFANGFVPAPKFASNTLQRGATSHRAKKLSGRLCGTAATPQLTPEALTNINAEPAINAGFNGKGVSVAYMADGV